MMNPLDASWSVLKGGFKTIDLIAQECDTMEECLASMQESFPDMDKEEAIKLVTEARNNHAREASRQNTFDRFDEGSKELQRYYKTGEEKPEEDVSFPDILQPGDLPVNENSNTKFAHASGRLPGQEPPPQDPNPLDLSMDKLKGLGEEQ